MHKTKHPQPQNQNQSRHQYDAEEQNFDALHFNHDVHDPQYSSMLPNKKQGKKHSSNSYFLTEPKYEGTNQVDNQSNQSQQYAGNQIKEALVHLNEKRKTKSKLLDEDFKAIEAEDNQNLIDIKKQSDDGNPEHLRNQLNQFNKLIQIRHYSQANMQNLKKFPSHNHPCSTQLNHQTKKFEKAVLQNLKQLSNNYWSLANQTFPSITSGSSQQSYSSLLAYPNIISHAVDVEDLWEQFENQTKFINKQIQEQLIKWSQKTTLLRNSTKGQYNSLIMHTPIGQTKKIMKDWNRVSTKAQQKRSVFKVLFQNQDNIKFPSDKSIYDDFDFYQEVQKVYQKQIEEDDDDDFRISDTMKHIKEREARMASRIKKEVDRKASKNRKLRFNVHPKLLNFMPCQLDNTMEARDQIVQNIFNNKGNIQGAQIDYIDM